MSRLNGEKLGTLKCSRCLELLNASQVIHATDFHILAVCNCGEVTKFRISVACEWALDSRG